MVIHMFPRMGCNSLTAESTSVFFSQLNWKQSKKLLPQDKGSSSFSQMEHLESKTLPGFLKFCAFSHCQLSTEA